MGERHACVPMRARDLLRDPTPLTCHATDARMVETFSHPSADGFALEDAVLAHPVRHWWDTSERADRRRTIAWGIGRRGLRDAETAAAARSGGGGRGRW